MIDIEKAENEFKEYVNKYDINNSQIQLKYYHTFIVEGLCEKIAISLGMNDEEINLAKLIGLLHDIARFEQYKKYKTFSDIHSIDHADLGVRILEGDSYIRKYIETVRYDNIILKAIKNHNKYSIESNLSEIEEIFCKIIRDADKLDIMYLATFDFWKESIIEVEEQTISQKVYNQFIAKQIIDKRNIQSDLDKVLVDIALIFDYNFKENYKIIKENNYINKTIDRFNFKDKETKEQMEIIRKIANDYIDNQIENN